MIKIGIDVGSTTVKLVAIDENDNLLFSKYERHNAKAKETILSFLKELLSEIGDKDISLRITGSIGMGISDHAQISRFAIFEEDNFRIFPSDVYHRSHMRIIFLYRFRRCNNFLYKWQ